MSLHWTRPTLVLLALALGGFTVWDERRPDQGELTLRKNHLVRAFRRDELVSLRLEVPGKAPIEILPDPDQPGEFQLKGPWSRAADAAAVQSLLTDIELASFVRTVRPGEISSSEFGAPRMRLHLQFRGFSAEISVHSPLPHGQKASYARGRTDGAEVDGIIHDRVADALLASDKGLIGTHFFSIPERKIQAISLKHNATSLHLKREGRKYFRLVQGSPEASLSKIVHPGFVERIHFALLQSKILGEVRPEEAQTLLAKDENRLRLEIRAEGSSSPEVLEFGSTCPSDPAAIVARRLLPEPYAACVPITVKSTLTHLDAELVLNRISALRSDEVDHLVIAGPKGRIDLLRNDSEWDVVGSGTKLALARGNALLDDLLESTGELIQGSLPDGAPEGRIELSFATEDGHGGTSREKFSYFRKGNDYIVRRDLDGALLRFPSERAWFLSGDPSYLADTKIYRLDEERLAQLVLRNESGQVRLDFSGGSRRVESPTGFELDAHLLRELLDQLSPLEVERFLPEAEPPGEAKVSLMLTQKDGSAFHLEVFGRGRGGYLARSPELPHPFVLSRNVVEILEISPLDRSPLRIDSANFGKFVFEYEEDTLTVLRSGEAFVAIDGESPSFLPAMAELLTEFEPIALVRLGSAAKEEGLTPPTLRLRISDNSKPSQEIALTIGAKTTFQGRPAYFARRHDVPATFVVARSSVDAWLDR